MSTSRNLQLVFEMSRFSFRPETVFFSESVLYYANYVRILTRTHSPSPSAILDFRSLIFGANDSDYEASQSVIFASFFSKYSY
jgi:hypothetical protein